ncbi:hypothetical protein BX616_001702 [Lobosporangium transversale]|uniref:NmrA family transcriptional regulator n=1 Tax=Lobosporangium transversale TaxID=64571 RepID=A0A1Y2H038_9FUNG|nr:NmrA family transcriptional regulator [Lobosporangium transversale]KAF9903152.1 hypothetical protein BX616_001702 [Lobosporangium transversale]ORZ27930.1 NmrA family transcriptional regulator [Lobosporangium transversale]|eukprot:XP_021885633.1 NmrA family transcriptional regulator [Lobosporangium transversale]
MSSSSETLAIFGATGQQGGSVINYVLNHPELSKQFVIRAVTRNPSKPAAQVLQQQGVEVVKGDLLYAKEIIQGKNLADAAVAVAVQYIIFSTVQHAGEVSSGKHSHVHAFNAKANIEKYIRSLPIKSAFFGPSFFYQDFASTFFVPQRQDNGTFTIFNVVSPQSVFEFFDPVADTGKFVGAILAEPDKFEGETLYAAATFCSFEEAAEMISKSTGKTVKYKQVSADEFYQAMPALSSINVHLMLFVEEFGFLGPKGKELAERSTKNIHAKLTTFEEYLQKNPLDLQ